MIKNRFIVLFCALAMIFLSAGAISCAKTPKKLETPQNVRVEKRVMTWDKIEGATDYTVLIKDEEYKTKEPRFELYPFTDAGNYYYQVKACGDGKKYTDSSWMAGSTELTSAKEHGFDELKFEYTLLKDKSGYEVSRGNANLVGEITIPDYFGDYPVTAIAHNAFYYEGNIGAGIAPDCFSETLCNTETTGVNLPTKLKTIGMFAFANMIKLEEIVIPDSVDSIYQSAFSQDKSLRRAVLPNGIKVINLECFKHTALEEIVIPESVEEIGPLAFACETVIRNVVWQGGKYHESKYHVDSKVSTVVFPKSVKKIGLNAFKGRENLKNIRFENISNIELDRDTFAETAYLKSQPDGIIYLDAEKTIVYGYNNMPQNFEFTVPSNVKFIAGYAFASMSNLKKIVIPNGIKFLGGCSFLGCKSLEEVTLPSDLEAIEDGMFGSCNSLKQITLPDGVTAIGTTAFSFSALESVKIPPSVKTIKNGAFSQCKKLEQVEFSYGLETVGRSAFDSCTALKNVILPDSVTEIAETVFKGCSSLESVVLPSSVVKLGVGAFANCKSLTGIYYGGSKEQWAKIDPYITTDNLSGNHFSDAIIYCYSATVPIGNGSYWHYAADGVTPEIW